MNVFLGRTLGVVDYGVFSSIISILSILAFPLVLGFDVALNNFTPAYIKNNKYDSIRGYIMYSVKSAILPVSLFIIIGIFFATGFLDAIGSSYQSIFLQNICQPLVLFVGGK